MGLSNEERQDIIAYRVSKSKETFQEAIDNAELGHWSLAANRLYYSVFYLTIALLLRKNILAKSHSGVFGMFSKEYIAKGMLNDDEGKLYRQLFTMRQSGDYDDLFDWTQSDISPLFPKVEALLNHLLSLCQELLDGE